MNKPMLTCRRCGQSAPTVSFSKDRRRKNGLSAYCKACAYDQVKLWLRSNAERALIAHEALCHRCHQTKPSDAFSRNRLTSTGLSRECKACQARRDIYRKYGLEADDIQRFMERQGGVCAICQSVLDKNCVVDHCHKTHRIRGLLCRKCNVAIGLFAEDPALLETAATYLRNAAVNTLIAGVGMPPERHRKVAPGIPRL